jgi:hypothetical protein
LEVIFALRFLIYQYGIVYHLNIANDNRSIMVLSLPPITPPSCTQIPNPLSRAPPPPIRRLHEQPLEKQGRDGACGRCPVPRIWWSVAVSRCPLLPTRQLQHGKHARGRGRRRPNSTSSPPLEKHGREGACASGGARATDGQAPARGRHTSECSRPATAAAGPTLRCGGGGGGASGRTGRTAGGAQGAAAGEVGRDGSSCPRIVMENRT